MPIIDEDEFMAEFESNSEYNQGMPDVNARRQEYGYFEGLAKSFLPHLRQDNTIGSLITAGSNAPILNFFDTPNPDFNPFDYVKDPKYYDLIPQANDMEELKSIIEFKDKQDKDREIIASTPFVSNLVSGIAAGLPDITTIIPGAKIIASTSKISGIGKSAVASGIYGASAATAQEVLLQATQTERTAEESSHTIIGGAILGAVLGSSISYFKKAPQTAEQIGSAVFDDIKPITPDGSTGKKLNPENRGIDINSSSVEENNPSNVIERKKEIYSNDSSQSMDSYINNADEKVINSSNNDPVIGKNFNAGEGKDNRYGETINDPEEDRLAYVPDNVAKWAQGLPFMNTSLISGITNQSDLVASMTASLFENTLITKRNVKGQASTYALESRMKDYEKVLYDLRHSQDSLYLDYLGIKKDPGLISGYEAWRKPKNSNLMNRRQYNEAVTMELIGMANDSPKQVIEAAKIYRKHLTEAYQLLNEANLDKSPHNLKDTDVDNIIDNIYLDTAERSTLQDELSKLNLLEDLKNEIVTLQQLHPEKYMFNKNLKLYLKEVKKDYENSILTYYMRSYDIPKIVSNREDMVSDLIQAFSVYNKNGLRRVTVIPIDDPTLRIEANKAIDNILGLGEGSLEFNTLNRKVSGQSINTLERQLKIPDKFIAKWIIKNPEKQVAKYIISAKRAYEFKNILNTYQCNTVEEFLEKIKKEFDDKASKITSTFADQIQVEDVPGVVSYNLEKDRVNAEGGRYRNKKLEDIYAQQKNALRIMEDIIKTSLNLHGIGDNPKAVQVLKSIRKYNTLRLMGGAAITNLIDTAMHITQHGLPKFIQAMIVDNVKHASAVKASKDQYKQFLIGTELEIDSILSSRFDPEYSDLINTAPVFDYLELTTNIVSGRVFFMSYLNRFQRRQAAYMAGDELFKDLLKYNSLSEKQKAKLAAYGIGKKEAKLILKQKDKVQVVDGIHILNPQAWDEEAKNIFGTFIRKWVDATVISPGKGDLPNLYHKHEIIKNIWQFRPFSFAAANKILVSGLQLQNMNILAGAISAISLGAMVYAIKERMNGREPSFNFSVLCKEGISRSGIFGVTGDMSFALLPGLSTSKYRDRNVIDELGGVSAKAIEDIYTSFRALSGVALKEDSLSKAEKNAMTRLIPLQNWAVWKVPLALMNN